MPSKKGKGRGPNPSAGKAHSQPPSSLESSKPPTVPLDVQKLTLSDANVYNPNIVASADLDDSYVEPVNLFIPDDASSLDSEEGEPQLMCLSPEQAAQSISNLATSAGGSNQVFLGINLSGYGFQDVSVLKRFVHLQKINLSYNSLTTLDAINAVENLVELDASHNNLTEGLAVFDPPLRNLRKANFSHNKIEKLHLAKLQEYVRLDTLDLSHNVVTLMRGLKGCVSLKHLSLANNRINMIEGINKLPLHKLNLAHNHIGEISKIHKIGRLQRLDLTGNNIFSLNGLENKPLLHELIMEDNSVTTLDEIDHLVHLKSLRTLSLIGCPVMEAVDYRRVVILKMPGLTELDRKPVSIEEKVSAVNLLAPPVEVQAALDHTTHTVYRFLQPSRVLESTLPSPHMPYPMLVLCGPRSSGKRELAHRLANAFPDYFGYGVSHTTRQRRPEERDGREYHFVTTNQFQALVRQGAFVQTFKLGTNLYGLTLEAVEAVAKEGLACVTHMELQGVRSLKTTHFEPRYVLILPRTAAAHSLRMRQRDVYADDAEMAAICGAETQEYVEADRQHPGFFDMVIACDALEDAYARLRQLVMDYLGVTADMLSAEAADPGNSRAGVNSRRKQRRNGSGGARIGGAWSRHSQTRRRGAHDASADPDSSVAGSSPSSRALSGVELIASRTPVEAASMLRRQEAAIEAIRGYGPDSFGGLFRQPIFPVPLTAPALLQGSPFAQASSMYQDKAFAGGGLFCEPGERIDSYDSMELIAPGKMTGAMKSMSEASRFSSLTDDVSFTNMSDLAKTDASMSSSQLRSKLARREVDGEPLDLSELAKASPSGQSGGEKTPGAPRKVTHAADVTTSMVGLNNRPVLPPIASRTSVV